MKFNKMYFINLFVGIALIVLSVVSFIRSDVLFGIFDIVLGVFNLAVFLLQVSLWWQYSPTVPNKFVFTCKHCGHQFIPSFWTWFFVPHIGSKRYMKCEKCQKISWMRRK